MDQEPLRHLILGTAGHIDHGKTSLVRQLTGIDTDRLPEERKHGITIDLGFADLELPGVRFGIVDVPGHERFVHNMVAGATGIDLALLVVAADDSVMPQTIEHLSILELLGVQAGLIAVTKIDLVEREHIELVMEELRDLLAHTFLANAPVVPVSSVTGDGLDELKEQLGRLARSYRKPNPRRVFRLPIDRVFTIQGHGTVVTGTVLSGSVHVGETLELMPQSRGVRIRRLQSHNADAEVVEPGQRAALNVAGVKNDELRRGDELAQEGYLQPARRLLTTVQMLRSATKPLTDRQLLRLHIGTQEMTVRAILKGEKILPGDSGFVELRSRELILADYGQRFILRQLSPVVTIGGGAILDPAISIHRRLRELKTVGAALSQSDPVKRLAGYLAENDVDSLTPMAFASRLGIDPAERDPLLEKLTKERILVRLGGKVLLHRDRRSALAEQILKRCERELRSRRLSRSLDPAVLVTTCRRLARPEIIDAMIADLLAQGKFHMIGDKISPAGATANLTKNQQRWQAQLLESCRQAGLSPPVIKELATQIGQPVKEIEALAQSAAEDGLLVRIGDGLYVVPETLEQARQRTVEHLQRTGPQTVAQLREVWGVSRKYAVPLCEFLDQQGITRRDGDLRYLADARSAT